MLSDRHADLYREVLTLDSEWAPARAALEEINAALASQRLETLLSRGYSALAEEEYAEAREHFEQALEAFEGAVIVVAHDRAFIESYAERVVELG